MGLLFGWTLSTQATAAYDTGECSEQAFGVLVEVRRIEGMQSLESQTFWRKDAIITASGPNPVTHILSIFSEQAASEDDLLYLEPEAE